MSFKVGDKIRLIGMTNEEDYYKKYLGEIFTIKEVEDNFVTVKEDVDIAPYFQNIELVKEYTYEDLKKSPLGTKVTFENKGVLLKTDEGRWENRRQVAFIENLEEFKDIDYGKIIKIEEPTYSTVYEYKPEILDKVEKRYLRGVIRPFRDKVKTIRKTDNSMNGKDNEYLTITLKEEPNMDFPNFKPNTMYKGMKLYKEYTLEELGL